MQNTLQDDPIQLLNQTFSMNTQTLLRQPPLTISCTIETQQLLMSNNYHSHYFQYSIQ